MSEKRIVILDEHPTYRVGLRTIVQEHTPYRIVDEIDDFASRGNRVLAVDPDLVIMDAAADGQSGTNSVRSLRAQKPELKVFVHSDTPSVRGLQFFLRQGARGYATKNLPALTLVHGLDTVIRGGTFICIQAPPSQRDQTMLGDMAATESWKTLVRELTPRERQVLDVILQGRQTKEIATHLEISPRTVENHRSNIMKKLSLHSQVDLVLYAARIGLIEV